MKVEDFMINDRICLIPMKWNELYNAMIKVYPERKNTQPISETSWGSINNVQKRNLFCVHLQFAISAGVAEDILKNVREDDWHYAKK